MEKLRVHTHEVDTINELENNVISNLSITVSTKDTSMAGTDANVFLRLGSLGEYPLNTVGENDFEKGDTKTYSLDTNFSLAALRSEKIELGHDNHGTMPGWCVSAVTIQVKFKESNELTLYKQWGEIGWLSTDIEPYFTILAELQEESE